MIAIRIDPHFQALIPPLSAKERAQLETNLQRDGCLEPLVLWGDVLLDGHNRYEICTRLGLAFRTVSFDFPSRDDAADWIDANQLGRRNLSPDAASLVRGRRYNRRKQATPNPAGTNQHTVVADQKDPQPTTAERLAAEHGVSAPTIKRDGQLAAAVDALKPVIRDIEQRVMSGDVPSRSAVVEAAREPARAADVLAKPHVTDHSGNNEWYTPPAYVDAARQAMGGIDLDPASSVVANQTVRAHAFFTAEDDGLTQPWRGRVWLNPPYAPPRVAQFVDAVCTKFDAGEISEACVLVNNATETAWFQRLIASASAVCLPRGRVRFLTPEGRPILTPLQGQAVIYLGAHAEAFTTAYAALGPVLLAQARFAAQRCGDERIIRGQGQPA